MKIFVTGYDKGVGKELLNRGCQPLRCDVLDLDDVNQTIHEAKPDVIIHTAQTSDIEYCETHEREAFSINVHSINNLVYDFSGILIYLSSVHVFDGNRKWNYPEKARPNPVSVYGFTKWAGEQIAGFRKERTVIIRTSQIFDLPMLIPEIKKLEIGDEFYSSIQMTRSFQYVPHFVDNLLWLIERLDQYPDLELLNIAGDDTWSYYEFFKMMARVFDLNQKLVHPLNQAESFHPINGGLNIHKAQKMKMPAYSATSGLQKAKKDYA